MTRDTAALADRLAALRADFDRSFAVPLQTQGPAPTQDLLNVRVGGVAYAIRASEVGNLIAAPTVTTLPSPVAALAGVVAVRGAILPVYDLAVALGHPPVACRWLAIDARRTVGLAFDAFEGHVRVAADAVVPRSVDAASRHVGDCVRVGDRVRPMVSIASVLNEITSACAQHR